MSTIQAPKKIFYGWILIVVLGLVLGACGFEREYEPEPTRRPIPPTRQPVAEPKVIIERAIAGRTLVQTERIDGTISKRGNLLEVDLDYVAPDRYYMNIQGIEIMVIGATGYAKVNGRWHVNPAVIATLQESLSDIERPSFEVLAAEFIEEVTYQNEKTHIYKFTINWVDSDGTGLSEGKVWIRLSDGLPVKTEEDLYADGLRFRVHYRSQFDLDLKIEPPV